MRISRRYKLKEAVRRMRKLDIINDAIKQFKRDGLIMVSEPPLGGLYYLDDEQKEILDAFEKEHNALVYLVVRAYTDFGKMDSFLYVSDYKEEWESDNDDITDGQPLTYTYNYDAPDNSEFGRISVRSIYGGLLRVS